MGLGQLAQQPAPSPLTYFVAGAAAAGVLVLLGVWIARSSEPRRRRAA